MNRVLQRAAGVLLVGCVGGASGVPLAAQSGQGSVLVPTRVSVGGGLIISEPKEEFDRNVGVGFGVGGVFDVGLDPEGWVGIRVDGGWLRYGHETKRVPFSETVGGRVLVDVATSNTIVNVGVGPEFRVPRGPVRPYVHAGFSGLLFRTTSSVSGVRSSNEPIASTTNLSDWTRAWVAGAGVRIPLVGGVPEVELDLGARYHRGGEARYLREGSIIDNPDGSITINPLQSRTPFMAYTLGVRVRIPRPVPAP